MKAAELANRNARVHAAIQAAEGNLKKRTMADDLTINANTKDGKVKVGIKKPP